MRTAPGGKARGEGLVFGLCIAFSLAGAVFGMAEEAIALTLLLAPALTRADYDSATAVLVCYGASQIGFATSWMNPFSVIVAQNIAGLPPMSGLEVRALLWLAFTLPAALLESPAPCSTIRRMCLSRARARGGSRRSMAWR